MRKLILEEWVSLDGYVADRNGSLDFFTQLTPEQNTYSDQDQLRFLETVDTISASIQHGNGISEL
jgi:hypothetical protein